MDKQLKAIIFSALVGFSGVVVAEIAPEDTAAASGAQGDYAPADFKLFVDTPTGFAFVKTPYGWKFIRSLDDAALGRYMKLEAQHELAAVAMQ